MIFKHQNNCKSGFTLSEVLVTLAMMGILGSILIPVILAQRPNPNKVMFKKEYMVLERAVSKLINDDTLYPASQTTTGATDGKTYQRGFSYFTDPTGLAGTKNKFCYHLAESLNTIGVNSCPLRTQYENNYVFATTSDGAVWSIYPSGTAESDTFIVDGSSGYLYNTRIIVDVNGAKAPNCSSDANTAVLPTAIASSSGSVAKCPNPDTFVFGVKFDGKIRPVISHRDVAYATVTDTNARDYLWAPLSNK